MFEQLPQYVQMAIKVAVIVGAGVIAERVTTRYLKAFIDRVEWPPEIEGALIPVSRALIILGCAFALMEVGGVPSAWLASITGIGGFAIGFASQRSIGNFVAGMYILASRPFRVGDYVKIDGIEGIVEEISINYTKILTPAYTTVLITNNEILNKRVVNYRPGESGYYCYSFEVDFDHSVPYERLHRIFEELADKYEKELPKRPEYCPVKLGRSERRYMFYLYFDDPKDIFTIQPRFLEDLIRAWDEARFRMA